MRIRKPLSRPYGFFMLVCGALALANPNSSFALGGPMGPDVTVRYSDLDLNTVAGASKLLKRIRLAAASVCEPVYTGSASSRVKRDQCVVQLTAESVAKVNLPMLLAVHESSLKKTKAKVLMPG